VLSGTCMYCGVHGCGASPSREIRNQRANALDCLGSGAFFYEIGSFEIMDPRKKHDPECLPICDPNIVGFQHESASRKIRSDSSTRCGVLVQPTSAVLENDSKRVHRRCTHLIQCLPWVTSRCHKIICYRVWEDEGDFRPSAARDRNPLDTPYVRTKSAGRDSSEEVVDEAAETEARAGVCEADFESGILCAKMYEWCRVVFVAEVRDDLNVALQARGASRRMMLVSPAA